MTTVFQTKPLFPLRARAMTSLVHMRRVWCPTLGANFTLDILSLPNYFQCNSRIYDFIRSAVGILGP